MTVRFQKGKALRVYLAILAIVLVALSYAGFGVAAKGGPEDDEIIVGVAAESDFTWVEITGGVSITGYSGGSGDLVIPSTLGGKAVLEIASKSYTSGGVFQNKGLTSVVIPTGIKVIGDRAFCNNQLTMVFIPHSVTKIGSDAFEGNKIGFVEIPDSVTAIGSWAFASNQLTSITIPNSVTSIENGVFYSNQLTSVNIPDSVTYIGVQAFSDNQLTSVTIPNSVTAIERYAFSSNQLTSVNIPNSVIYLSGFFRESVDQCKHPQ